MPHAFLNTNMTPLELAELWQENSFYLEHVRIKIRKGYSNSENLRAIFPCLIIEPQHKKWFYIEVCVKDKNRLLIHLDPVTQVQRTAGVRLALAWFVQRIALFDDHGQIEGRNLAAYFKLLTKESSEQTKEFIWLQRKLTGQLQAAFRREQSKKYSVSLIGKSPPLDLENLFNNKNPVEIEIGPGKGNFILNEAKKNPEKNYLAIEWAGRYLKDISEKVPMANIENVRLLDADARDIFKDWISDSSVAALHIYYPDPWWKRKHQKHKLLTRNFLKNLEHVLQKKGIFYFLTDVQEVYLELQNIITRNTLLKLINEKKYRSGKEPPPGRTNFEIKKWQKGSDIFEAAWQKI